MCGDIIDGIAVFDDEKWIYFDEIIFCGISREMINVQEKEKRYGFV